MYLKTKEHRSTHPRNRYQAGKHLIVPHRRSSVVNSNSIHPQNGQGHTETCTYDAANRMTGVSTTTSTPLANRYPDQATSAAYHYDALGRRVQEDYRRTQTTLGSGGATTERIDQGSRITFYDALGFNPIARSDYRGQIRSTIEADGTVRSRTRSFGDPSPKEVLTYAGNELVLHTGLSIYQEDARTLVGFQDVTYLHQDQLGSTIHLCARNPASSRIARASSPLERRCAVKPNSCTTARTSCSPRSTGSV